MKLECRTSFFLKPRIRLHGVTGEYLHVSQLLPAITQRISDVLRFHRAQSDKDALAGFDHPSGLFGGDEFVSIVVAPVHYSLRLLVMRDEC